MINTTVSKPVTTITSRVENPYLWVEWVSNNPKWVKITSEENFSVGSVWVKLDDMKEALDEIIQEIEKLDD